MEIKNANPAFSTDAIYNKVLLRRFPMNLSIRLLALMGLLILWAAIPSKAHAVCYEPNQIFFNGPPKISDSRSIGIGGTLWSGQVNPIRTVAGACSPFTGQAVADLLGSGSLVASNVYATNVSGVGIRINFTSSFGACNGFFPREGCYIVDNSYTNSMTFQIDLIKTGTVSGGTLRPIFGIWSLWSGGTYAQMIWGTQIVVAPDSPTCSVNTNSTQTVNLGNYTATQFTGVGSMTPPQTFNINFNCSGGTAGAASNIYITMTDATVPSNRTSNLNLASGSTAGGVAVRIQRNGGATDVLFGADSATIGNTNQWLAGTVPTGTSTFAVPLQARMVQTGTVKVGNVSAKATFTVAYN